MLRTDMHGTMDFLLKSALLQLTEYNKASVPESNTNQSQIKGCHDHKTIKMLKFMALKIIVSNKMFFAMRLLFW